MIKTGNKKIKALIALSGGVDSAVAAALLVRQGLSVTGAYMVNYDVKDANTSAGCWLPDYRDALRVGAALGIPVIKLDFTKEYKEKVLDVMFKEYNLGRTPNPDVMCNKFIKFGVWLEKAKEMGFDYLATGHYARVKFIANSSKPTVRLLESKDKNKDQTYFLHQLSQEQLSRVMFPIGGYLKSEVRSMARRFSLPVAEKEESMGICFIGEVPMKEFLQTKIKPKPGKIVMSDGSSVGRHDGLAFYTIGQRHIGHSPLDFRPLSSAITKSPESRVQRPLYVVAKRQKTNELVVGYEDDTLLYSREIAVDAVNWVSGQEPKFPLKCMVRLRHRQPLQPAVVSRYTLGSSKFQKVQSPESRVRVAFVKPQRSVTPGQFAVFYAPRGGKIGECLGGGVIE